MGRNFLIVLFAAVLTVPFAGFAAADGELDGLKRDIKELKRENDLLNERLAAIEVKDEQDTYNDSKLVNVSGYADVEYDFSNQSGVYDHFRIRHFSLFFSQKVQKEWNLFSEIEWEDAPLIQANPANDSVLKAQGQFLMEQMYIQYRPGPEFDVSAGRLLTPAGIWLIYHYAPFVPTQERPLQIRQQFPQYSDGLQMRYSFNFLNSLVDTHLYAANGQGNPGGADRNANKAGGGRVNVSSGIPAGKLDVGASYLSQEDKTNGLYQNSYGLHLKLNFHALGIQSEYATRQNMPLGGSDNFWDTGLYMQGTYDIGRWTLCGRWDWYNNNSLTPMNDHHVYTGAVNYHFAHNVISKAEIHRHEFNNPATPNYYLGIVSVVVALGDL